MVILNIIKSSGKTVYLFGLRVFVNPNGVITLAYDIGKPDKTKKGKTTGGICYINDGTNAHKFFKKLLKEKINL